MFGSDVKLVKREAASSLSEISDADCAEADGLMIMGFAVTGADLARFPKLRCIVRMGVGYDKFGAPWNPTAHFGDNYMISKAGRPNIYELAPNGLSQSNVGVKVNEPIVNGVQSGFFAPRQLSAQSFQWSRGSTLGSGSSVTTLPLRKIVILPSAWSSSVPCVDTW